MELLTALQILIASHPQQGETFPPSQITEAAERLRATLKKICRSPRFSLHRTFSSLPSDTQEEILQEFFITLYDRFPRLSFSSEGQAISYLLRSAKDPLARVVYRNSDALDRASSLDSTPYDGDEVPSLHAQLSDPNAVSPEDALSFEQLRAGWHRHQEATITAFETTFPFDKRSDIRPLLLEMEALHHHETLSIDELVDRRLAARTPPDPHPPLDPSLIAAQRKTAKNTIQQEHRRLRNSLNAFLQERERQGLLSPFESFYRLWLEQALRGKALKKTAPP